MPNKPDVIYRWVSLSTEYTIVYYDNGQLIGYHNGKPICDCTRMPLIRELFFMCLATDQSPAGELARDKISKRERVGVKLSD